MSGKKIILGVKSMNKLLLIIVFPIIAGILFFTNYRVQILPNNTDDSVPKSKEEINAYFNIVDKSGQPFKPEKAWWYYPPNGGQVKEYPARCLNEGCTRWGVVGATGKRIYVAARFSRKCPESLSYCVYSAYNASPIDLSSGSAPEVTLVLEEHL